MGTIIHSQPTDTYANENTETDFNSTLFDNGTLFSSHTLKILVDLADHGQIMNQNNNNNDITNDTTKNTIFHRNHRHRQPVVSIELTQNLDRLNTNKLPIVNTPLPRLLR